MKKLVTKDIFAFCRLLKKVGAKEEFEKIAEENDNIKSVWDKGFELIWGIFDKATETVGEDAIYDFLAGPFECSSEDVANMSIPEIIENIKTLVKENDLEGFFASVQRLMR